MNHATRWDANPCERAGPPILPPPSKTLLEKLKQRLLKIIDPQKDSLRFYRLPGDREKWVEVYGLDHYEDFDAPLII